MAAGVLHPGLHRLHTPFHVRLDLVHDLRLAYWLTCLCRVFITTQGAAHNVCVTLLQACSDCRAFAVHFSQSALMTTRALTCQGSMLLLCGRYCAQKLFCLCRVITVWQDERKLVRREVHQNVYSLGTFFWSKTCTVFPFEFVFVLLVRSCLA